MYGTTRMRDTPRSLREAELLEGLQGLRLDGSRPSRLATALHFETKKIRTLLSCMSTVLPMLSTCLKSVDMAEAKAALIWMIGEYGEELPSAPYILEPLIDVYTELESPSVKLNLLTATMKLLFKRPPEVRSMLGRLMAVSINDTSSQDVHDRALLYYRLLMTNLDVAQACTLREPRLISGTFAEDRDESRRRDNFNVNFNTLCIITDAVLSPDHRAKAAPRLTVSAEIPAVTLSDPKDCLLGDDDTGSGVSAVQADAGSRARIPDLLDMGDLGPSLPVTGDPIQPDRSISPLVLDPYFTFDPERFQQLWSTEAKDAGVYQLKLKQLPASTAQMEIALQGQSVLSLASGDLPDALKFFLYARDHQSRVYLVQALVSKGTFVMDLTLKIHEGIEQAVSQSSPAFVELIRQAMLSIHLL